MKLKEILSPLVFVLSIFFSVLGFFLAINGGNVASALVFLAGWIGILFYVYCHK